MLSRQHHAAAVADQRNDYEQRVRYTSSMAPPLEKKMPNKSDPPHQTAMLRRFYILQSDDDYHPQQQQQQQQQREGATSHDPITIDSRDDVDHQSSFGLLNHSFDTLSETGTSSLRLSPCNESDLRRSFEMSPLSSSNHHNSNSGSANNVVARGEPPPPPPPQPSSEQLLGDISPIKVTFGRHRTQKVFEETSVMPDEWQQDRDEPAANDMMTETAEQKKQQQQPSSTTSTDPMRVLYSVKHSFCHMKYLLASLQTTTSGDDVSCADDGPQHHLEASVRTSILSA
jgi:hypothetical protein